MEIAEQMQEVYTPPQDYPRLLSDDECAAEAADLEESLLDIEDWRTGQW